MQRKSLQKVIRELDELNAQIKKESSTMRNLLDLVVELDEDASNYAKISTEFLEAGATDKADKYEKLAVELKAKSNLLRKELEKTQAQVEDLTAGRNDLLMLLGQMRGTLLVK